MMIDPGAIVHRSAYRQQDLEDRGPRMSGTAILMTSEAHSTENGVICTCIHSLADFSTINYLAVLG